MPECPGREPGTQQGLSKQFLPYCPREQPCQAWCDEGRRRNWRVSQAFPPWSHAAPWGLRLVTGQTEPQSKFGILGWAGLGVGGSAGQRVGTVMSPLFPTLAKVWANGCRPRGTATGQEAETLNQRLPPYWLPHLGAPSQLPQFSSVTQLCPTLCDPMDCSTPGFPVHDQFPETYSNSCPSSR